MRVIFREYRVLGGVILFLLFQGVLLAGGSGSSIQDDLEECKEYDRALEAASRFSKNELAALRKKAREIIKAGEKPDGQFLVKWEKFGEYMNSLKLDPKVVLTRKNYDSLARTARAARQERKRLATSPARPK